jgi:hypothetical protein
MCAYFVLFLAVSTLSIYGYAGGCISSCYGDSISYLIHKQKVDAFFGSHPRTPERANEIRNKILRDNTLSKEQKHSLISPLKVYFKD